MVEKIADMPAGTIGFRASGKLTPEDYQDVLVPTLREAVDAGEVRMLFVLSDFEELEPRAWLEDAKTGLRARLPQPLRLEALGDRHRRRVGQEGLPHVRLDDARRSQGLRPRPGGRRPGAGSRAERATGVRGGRGGDRPGAGLENCMSPSSTGPWRSVRRSSG